MDRRKKWISTSVIICLLLIISGALSVYIKFSSGMVYKESSQHLTEIYVQVTRAFQNTMKEKWEILDAWDQYLETTTSDDKVLEYIQEQQEKWGFEDFYFISADGSFRTSNGETGFVDLKEQVAQLVKDKEPVFNTIALPGSQELQLIAVPSRGGEYQGFKYNAIAFSYESSDMVDILNASAFDGEADSYVVSANGRVMIDNVEESESNIYNFFSFLENDTDMGKEEREALKKDFHDRKSGVTTFRSHGAKQYMVYISSEIMDDVVLGIVPVRVVNASMNRLQLVTMTVMLSIIAVPGLILLLMFVRKSRKQLEEKERGILYREELFSTLSDNVDDVFLMLDAGSLSPDFISPNIDKLMGINRQQVIAFANSIDDKTEQDPLGILKQLIQITSGERKEWDCSYVHRMTGENRWFHLTAYRTDIRSMEKFVVVLSDRTEALQMNKSLSDALELTKSANEAKSNFLANMSHDIRTPMNAVLGFATLLSRDAYHPDKVLQHTRKIVFSSQHLLGLINDILDMSKIESGQTVLNVTEFYISDLLDEINNIIYPQAKAKNQTFEIRTKGSVPGAVQGDRMRVNQILLNLLSNALKYTQEGGEVFLTMEVLPQNIANHVHLQFEVSDNGYGMSSEFLETIFEPFARENTVQKREIQGTGLGMAITKNIVDLMGGNISVESSPGAGSIFNVELELQMAERDLDDTFWVDHNLTRLLVVDDEEEVCRDIQEVMSDTGVEVLYATTGQAAVEMAEAACRKMEDFSIILLDWKMPGMDGIETARCIRRVVGNDVPIMVLTAYDYSEIEEEAREAGIDLFLPKPFFELNFRRIMGQYYQQYEMQKDDEEEILDNPLEGLNVLAAEDNELNAEILQELLDMEGASCEWVKDGQEALERFENADPGKFDIIFMDIQMPVMDGYEATKRIRTCRHPDADKILIVAMTANAFEEDVRKARSVGMNAHASKPVDIDKLKQTVRSLKKENQQTRRKK